MLIEDLTDDIRDAILTKLSFTPVVGDVLERLYIEDYDLLENELDNVIRETIIKHLDGNKEDEY